MKMAEKNFYFCRNISYIRKFYHLSQTQMASIMGISVSTLRRIEKGTPRVRMNAEMLCKLCDHFDLSCDAVIYIDFAENNEDPADFPPCR